MEQRGVSVIMPVYNAANSAVRAASSVLSQEYGEFELIVCDDGSTDGTLEAVAELSRTDARIRVVSHDHAGVSYARNSGLEEARYPLIAFIDCDDIAASNWLSTLVEGLGTADMAACGYEVVGPNGARAYSTLDALALAAGEALPLTGEQMMVALFSNDFMYQGYVWNKLFRRALIERGAPVRFRRGITQNEDRLFVFEYLFRCTEVAMSLEPCYAYSLHGAPTAYASSMATELMAFDCMLAELRARGAKPDARSESPLDRALFYAEKDYFRAHVELYCAAEAAGNADALWLAEPLFAYRGYADEFEAYPPSFHYMMDHALGSAAPVE